VETHKLSPSVTINTLKNFGEDFFSICWEKFDMNLGMKGEKLDLEMIKKLNKFIENLSVELENSDNNIISSKVQFGMTKRTRGILRKDYKCYDIYHHSDGKEKDWENRPAYFLGITLPDYLKLTYEILKWIPKYLVHIYYGSVKFPRWKRFYTDTIKPRQFNKLKKNMNLQGHRFLKNKKAWNMFQLSTFKIVPTIFFVRKTRRKMRNFICFPKNINSINEEKIVNQLKKEKEKKRKYFP